jgi:hypothetical protein
MQEVHLVHTSFSIPKVRYADDVLVHSVRPSGRGFQAWMSRPDAPGLVVCDCGWFLPEKLSPHYRFERANSA